jgi:translation elongation factor EF-4
VMHPEEVPTSSLQPGQVGYIACNMKESSEGGTIAGLFC